MADTPTTIHSDSEDGCGEEPDAERESSAASLRPFFVLWGGQALSLLGTQAVQFALVWWLTLETGSAAVLASATLVALLPRAVFGAFIGTLVDRWNRRHVMLVADLLLALAAGVLALLFLAGVARPWHVLVLVLVRSIGSAFHEAAMLASTSLMVPRSALTRVQGLNQGLQGLMLVVAPPLGALLVSRLPMAGIMGIDVVTAACAIVPLLFIMVPQPLRTSAAAGGASVLRETLEGFRFLAARRGHLVLLAIAALVNLFLTPAFSLLPLLVHQGGGGALRLGWASSSIGVGLLVGGIALGLWGGFERRVVTSLSGLIVTGLAVLMMVAVPVESWLFLVALLLVGAMSAMVNGPIQAVLQATIAADMQGRVFALYGSLASIAAPLGLALAAPVAEWLGVISWYVAGGLAAMLAGAIGLFVPALMRLEEGENAIQPVGAS